MIKLPKQLQKKEFRFIQIQSGTKRPLNANWQMSENYKFTEDEFKHYLQKADAYGVVCGFGNLAVVDADKDDVAKEVMFNLPKTFTVKTGGGGYHFFFKVPDLDKKIVLQDNNGVHYGEVQFTGSQVLGATSKHPNGNHYEILHDEEIQEIDKKTLVSVLSKFMKFKKTNQCESNLDLDIMRVAKHISGLDNVSNGLQGSHPIHGSDGGMNFRIDPDKNVWHCFRHQTGGDAISLIGVLEGLIDCSECTRGLFKEKKDLFRKIQKIANEKYGYNIPNTARESEFSSPVPVFIMDGKKKILNIMEIAEYIKEKITFIVVEDTTGRKPHIYYYEDGHYQMKGDKEIEKIIKKLFGVNWKTHYKNEIMDYLKTENVVDRDDIIPPKRYINFNNGVYDVKTKKLKKHDPKYRFLYKIPHNYNPKARCPNIQKYFKSTLLPEYIKLSQEIFGYCMYSDYPIAAIFYLYGTGGNGKSVWIHLLTKMLGEKNVVAKDLHSIINNRFTSAQLYGSLANISGELTDSILKNTDTLKRLSAGDWMQAEFKGKDGFDFRNTAKVITACNSIPYSTDFSYGWYQRQYILPFLQKFRKTKAENTDLKYELTATEKEMEGLIAWAIEGLQRVLKCNSFSYPDNMGDIYSMYQRNSSYFIEKTYSKSNASFDDFIPFDEIWDEYSHWCEANNIPKESQNSVARQLTYFKFTADDIYDEEGKKVRIRRYIKRI